MTRTRPTPETSVPPGEEPAARCPYCERPFAAERLCSLHVGETHDGLADEERERYEAARDAEGDELFVFHLKVVAAIAALYAVFVLGYMFVLAGGFA